MGDVKTGLETCLETPPAVLRDAARFGLLANQASVNDQFEYASVLLARRFPGQARRACSRRSMGSGVSSRKT